MSVDQLVVEILILVMFGGLALVASVVTWRDGDRMKAVGMFLSLSAIVVLMGLATFQPALLGL